MRESVLHRFEMQKIFLHTHTHTKHIYESILLWAIAEIYYLLR